MKGRLLSKESRVAVPDDKCGCGVIHEENEDAVKNLEEMNLKDIIKATYKTREHTKFNNSMNISPEKMA